MPGTIHARKMDAPAAAGEPAGRRRMLWGSAAYLCLTAAFLALLWLPNLAFLALTGRGMFNYLVFRRNLFPGDDWLYVALGTLVLSALAAFLVKQRLLLVSLLRYLNRPVPDGGNGCAELPSAGRA